MKAIWTPEYCAILNWRKFNCTFVFNWFLIVSEKKEVKMPGVVFVIVVPTANFEQEILNGKES